MKYNISISVDEKFNEMIEEIREDSKVKGQSLSFAILDSLVKSRNKSIPTKLTLDAEFDEIQRFAQEIKIDELKQISHKASIIMLTLEAFIKYDSYEHHRKKQFPNAREAERYLRG